MMLNFIVSHLSNKWVQSFTRFASWAVKLMKDYLNSSFGGSFMIK